MVSSEEENLKLQEPLGKADLIGRPETWPGQLASHAIPKARELWLHSHQLAPAQRTQATYQQIKEQIYSSCPLRGTAAPEQTCEVTFAGSC